MCPTNSILRRYDLIECKKNLWRKWKGRLLLPKNLETSLQIKFIDTNTSSRTMRHRNLLMRGVVIELMVREPEQWNIIIFWEVHGPWCLKPDNLTLSIAAIRRKGSYRANGWRCVLIRELAVNIHNDPCKQPPIYTDISGDGQLK